MKVNRATRKWIVISGLWVLALAGIATSTRVPAPVA